MEDIESNGEDISVITMEILIKHQNTLEVKEAKATEMGI